MSTIPAGNPPQVPGLRRRVVPLAALAVLALVLTVMWLMPPERFDRGMRSTFSFLSGVVALAVIAFWFFALSGVRGRIKTWVVAAALLVACGAVVAVRRVEFFGGMEPTFDFRWQVSREELLDQRLAAQKAQPKPALDVAKVNAFQTPTPQDTPQYRGAHRDGIVVGPRLAREWESRPPRPLWRQACGGGYAGFAVIGDLAITIEQRRAEEVVVAYEVSTGRELWSFSYPALFAERLGGDGPRATPAISRGRVYSLGAQGDLVCLDARDGQLIWEQNILAENGCGNLDWGMSGSPLVADGQLFVNPGTQKGTEQSAGVFSLDPMTGKQKWKSGSAKASYASPMLVTLLGTPTLLIFDAVGIAGYDPERGAELWRFDWKSDFDVNAAQPIVLGDDQVLITSAAGCARLKLAREGRNWTVEPVWRNRLMKASYSNPIEHDGFLYGLDEGIMACLDLATGERRWKKGRYGHGQILLSGDLIVVLSEKGELALVEATPQEFRELARIQAIDGKTWNNPALVGNRMLVRNHLEMACYELPLATPGDLPGDAKAAGATSPDATSSGKTATSGAPPDQPSEADGQGDKGAKLDGKP